jgi:threonine aldolase
MRTVDLRSDTLTKPSKAMLAYMFDAEVGDDVFAEDPTINALQEKMMELTGKEAALFVPSGTMANQISINAHTIPGNEVICEARCHIYNYEAGAPGMLSGVQLHPIHGQYGVIDLEDIENALRPTDHHFAQTALICLENTHNRWGGTIYPIDEIKKMSKFAVANSIKLQLDGARLWNASIASGISIKEYASYFDSVSLCFSKGLGAPVGSILVGSREFIDRAHYYRKVYGGGMRQAGILAAAAIYAIDNQWQRLVNDHNRAKVLAEAFNTHKGFVVNLKTVQTNIVLVDVSLTGMSADEVAADFEKYGVTMIPFSKTRLRAVTYQGISDNDIDYAIDVISKVCKNSG